MTEIERRKFLLLSVCSALGLALSGCRGISDDMTLDEIIDMIKGELGGGEETDEEELGPVKLALTYPAGRSPNVFVSGWIFGAKCTVGGQDMSSSVRWSGTATFNPDIGATSRPVFNSEGSNKITISIDIGDKKYEKSVTVNAVSTSLYVGVGDMAVCPADAHGCPACPHPTTGPVTTGSPNVFVNGKPAARVGDKGVHAACCGQNTFEIISGDSTVLINGRAAAKRAESVTKHCGGSGYFAS